MCFFMMLLCFIFSSCAPMNGGNQEVAGAGTGALAGAVVGQMLGKSTEATLLGAAIGGALGYAVGWQIKSQARQVYTQQQTRQLVADTGGQKKVVQVRSESVEPKKQFKPGEKVTVRVTYIILDSQQQKVAVHEKKTLWFKGAQQAVFEDTTINRENGTWESSITFQLPSDVEKGDYQVRQDIYSGQTRDSANVQFSVI
ncbi:MAG: hypothetical protein CSA20_08065 [Deltaproteobacteria bacterium]|nr:MAG: hypothetical protein CSA20_08065 [Deltaproteobacteria bacterium]